MTTSVTVTAGFDRCLEPDCTAAPTGAFAITSGGLIVQCGVCEHHTALAAQLRAMASSAKGAPA